MATLLQTVNSYLKSQSKAGSKGLALTLACIEHGFQHGDTTQLAWLISKADAKDSQVFRAIAGKVMGGVTMKKDARQPSGIKIDLADNAGPTDKMPILKRLVEDQVSFRSTRVQEELLAKAKVEAEFDLHKLALAFVKKMAKEEVSVASMMLALKGAQQELSTGIKANAEKPAH